MESNSSNDSSHATLHLLRESSVDRAASAFPEAESIYEPNKEAQRAMGAEGWNNLIPGRGTDVTPRVRRL